jgi:hypothetical protein
MNRHTVASGKVVHFVPQGDFVALQTPIDQDNVAAVFHQILRNRAYRRDTDPERQAQHLGRIRPCAREDPVRTLEYHPRPGRYARH